MMLRKMTRAFSTAPSRKGIKRFFEKVSVAQQKDSLGYQVLLDGRPIRSPAQAPLRLPTEEMATAVALEWDSVGELIEPHLMPMMTAVSTVTDHLPKNRELYYDELLKYLDTDTLCIRAPPREEELHALQKEKWNPVLHWMGDSLNCHLETTSALGKRPDHHDDARSVAEAHLHELNDFELQAMFMFTTVCKSLSIGFALLHGEISIEDGVSAARLEEEYQIEQWGMVEGGHDVDRVHIAVQVSSGRVLLRSM